MTHASLSDEFRAAHAPGSREKPAPLTASRWPAVLKIPAELKSGWPRSLPSRLSLALHMINVAPFNDSDTPLFRRGRYMERFGEDMLRERGIDIRGTQVRVEHPRMNALTYLDVLTLEGRAEGIVEFKTVDERDYRVQWADGPPLYPFLQVQCQSAISGIQRLHIGAIIRGYKGDDLVLHEVTRDEETIQLLEDRGQEFLDLIRDTPPERLAEILIEEDNPSSYQAWSRVASLAKGPTATLEHPEAVKRAKRLYQARLDGLAAEKIKAAEANWFAVHAPQAEHIELADGTKLTRKVVAPTKVAAFIRAQHVKWDVKPAGEESGYE